MDISEYEARKLFGRFDEDGDGTVDYNEFCNAIYPCQFSTMGTTNAMNHPVPKNQTWIQAEQKKEKQSKLSKEELAFRSRFDNMKYQLRKQFRIQDESRNGLLDEEAFVNAISITDQSITDDDLFAFTTKFFPYAGHLIDYNDLMEQIFD